ncbi:hypothetical protein RclHR1_06570001 [Rhizophagus clarus]|uniref:HTH CENPB-type domain-containing protein n=1 Tax=Rhizophagus clarus TaxID=94130 RepID=A0A2Z6SIX5_9GLOM|nr:hypothetical protein RclHR1_06570001 [Rhizophagus clarus]
MIKEKAFYFAQEFNIPYENILFSNGWIEKFKRHNNICCYRLHGKANSIPLEILFEKRRKLQTILQDYILDNIFNADETSLFFCMAPNQTLVSALTSGIKLDKTRITVLLATNAIGTQKLKPLVIGSSKNPRCLHRVNRNSLPLHFLPPNTTAHLQSMDAGIIKSLRQFINNITYDILFISLNNKINVKEAMEYVAQAWDSVKVETIVNCWQKTGILPNNSDDNNGIQ